MADAAVAEEPDSETAEPNVADACDAEGADGQGAAPAPDESDAGEPPVEGTEDVNSAPVAPVTPPADGEPVSRRRERPGRHRASPQRRPMHRRPPPPADDEQQAATRAPDELRTTRGRQARRGVASTDGTPLWPLL